MKRFTSRFVLYGFLTIYSLIILVPIYWMVISGFKANRDMFLSPFSLPIHPQWSTYAVAWENGIKNYILNSLFVTATSVLLILFTSGLAAYVLARMKFPGRVQIFLVLITGFAIPVHTVLVPLSEILRDMHWINTYQGLIGPYVAFGIPFSVLLLYPFFLEFPKDLEDAARLDGCSNWQMIWKVVLPLSTPGLATVAIFQGVSIWNEFLLALIIINDDKLKTLPLGLTIFHGQYMSDWPASMAAVTIATIPLLILFLTLQRQFINSLTGFSR
jgi:ABC-type glycerol-3-phosphate transport system permease component